MGDRRRLRHQLGRVQGVCARSPAACPLWSDEVGNRVIAVNLTGVRLRMKDEIKEMLKRGGGAVARRSADVGAHVAAAPRPTQKSFLDKRLEQRVARLRFQVLMVNLQHHLGKNTRVKFDATQSSRVATHLHFDFAS